MSCPTSVMDELNRIFLAYDEYRIIVCTICQFAVVPSQTEHHLRKHHSRLTYQQRRIVAQKVQSLPQLALVESDVIYPRPDQPPINTLPIFFDGLKCTGKHEDGNACRYMCRTITGIQKHCKDEHGWINIQKRGGDARDKQVHSENRLWECNRACQRFFKVGRWQRYFEVAASGLQDMIEHTTNQKHLFF